MDKRSRSSRAAPFAHKQANVETAPLPVPDQSLPTGAASLWLVILWSESEPHRVGHSALCENGRVHVLGRAPQARSGESPLSFAAVRPVEAGGAASSIDSVLGEALSRRQLEIRAVGNCLVIRNIGRCPMWVNGALASRAKIGHGDVVYLQQQLLLLCVSRPPVLPALCGYPRDRLMGFGQADADGLVGESHALWLLRQQLASCASRDGHILIVGSSGVGKELVARALHQLSRQRRPIFVAENIATIPPNLGTALLFGNRRNFPNPGMEERAGLIGMAEGGTLFLDEIGDMSEEVQPLLLRVMDRGAEYVRLGEEGQPRRAQVRFVAATNHPQRLRPELRRRFQHEIHVPDLSERREDIPLLVRHMLIARAQQRSTLVAYLHNDQPIIDPRFLEQLVRHSYSTHVSELGFLLEQAASNCEARVLLPLPQQVLRRRLVEGSRTAAGTDSRSDGVAADPSPASPSGLPTPEQTQRAIELELGNVARAATRLGISRHQLNRLIRRHDLTVSRVSSSATEDSRSMDDGAQP